MFDTASRVRGGCVWQSFEVGQDGFQVFDRLCRHAEIVAILATFELLLSRFLLFKPVFNRRKIEDREERRATTSDIKPVYSWCCISV